MDATARRGDQVHDTAARAELVTALALLLLAGEATESDEDHHPHSDRAFMQRR